MTLRYLTVLFALLLSTLATADDRQAWTALSVSGPAADDGRLLLWFDGHARFRDDADRLGVTIIRPGIGWKASDQFSLWGGYARVISRTDDRDFEEDRIWEQATYPVTNIFGGSLSGRTRVEQRMADGEGDTGHRLRQFWRWARPIDATQWSWVVANETFFSLNSTDWGQRSGYNQNRLYLGVTWAPEPAFRLEFSYLYNHIDGRRGQSQQNQNLSIALFFAL